MSTEAAALPLYLHIYNTGALPFATEGMEDLEVAWLAATRSLAHTPAEHIQRELRDFRTLREDPRIASITRAHEAPSRYCFHVDTKLLWYESGDTRWNMGAYRIVFDARYLDERFYALTFQTVCIQSGRLDGALRAVYQAKDCNVCFGTETTPYLTWLAHQGLWCDAVEVALMSLTHVNSDEQARLESQLCERITR